MPPTDEHLQKKQHSNTSQTVKHSTGKPAITPKHEEQQEFTRQPVRKTNITEQKKQQYTGTSPLDRISLKINQPDSKPDADSKQDNERAIDKPANPFTYESFFEVWKKIATAYKEESPGLYMAMMKNKPLLKTDKLFEVYTDNAIQRDLYNEKKPEILRALHHELNNYTIDIIAVIKATKKKDIAYLPAEKLEKLIEKNPVVEKMKNDFGLDLDY